MPKTTVPILEGIYSDVSQNIRVSLPVNLIPLQVDSGMGHGYMRPAWGITTSSAAGWSGNGGPSRGSINWNGTIYRVIGAYLYSISSDGVKTNLGYVGNDGTRVTMDYSYTALCIVSAGLVYFYNIAFIATPTTITPVNFIAYFTPTIPSTVNVVLVGTTATTTVTTAGVPLVTNTPNNTTTTANGVTTKVVTNAGVTVCTVTIASGTMTQLIVPASPPSNFPNGPAPGYIVNVRYVQGYFAFTDGQYLILTDIVNPTTVLDADGFYQSQSDPSTVQGMLLIRNEMYLIMRYTMDVLYNTGTGNMPFAPILGAQSMKGCVGSQAFCYLENTIFFIGGARNEDVGVYVGYNGVNNKVSTREIDLLLNTYTTDQLSQIFVEKVFFRDVNCVFIHLPDRTLVYDAGATVKAQKQVWYVLTSALAKGVFSAYLGIDFQVLNGSITMGHPGDDRLGVYVDTLASNWETAVRWEVSTSVIFNVTNGISISSAELVCMQGTMQTLQGSVVGTDFSQTGLEWSVPRYVSANIYGETMKRIIFLRLGWARTRFIQRFFGDSNGPLSIVALVMDISGLDA